MHSMSIMMKRKVGGQSGLLACRVYMGGWAEVGGAFGVSHHLWTLTSTRKDETWCMIIWISMHVSTCSLHSIGYVHGETDHASYTTHLDKLALLQPLLEEPFRSKSPLGVAYSIDMLKRFERNTERVGSWAH